MLYCLLELELSKRIINVTALLSPYNSYIYCSVSRLGLSQPVYAPSRMQWDSTARQYWSRANRWGLPIMMSAARARVMATLRRRGDATNPTVCRTSDSIRRGLLRTVDRIIAIRSCPWNSSTEPTFGLWISRVSSIWRILKTCKETRTVFIFWAN